MILLDTNILIYAMEPNSPFFQWSRHLISQAGATENAVVNPITVAELCVGDTNPTQVPERLLAWGLILVDLPVVTSLICAKAYSQYRKRRATNSGKTSPATPLPDFFIGAHAEVMGWDIATADRGRFNTYFPKVSLILPEL